MRLLLVGAFPYPLAQGSQVYLQEQARALAESGVSIELLTYGSGRPDPRSARALEGFVHHTPPAWTAPGRMRSGPGWGKPLADLALTRHLRHVLASRKTRADTADFDAILTHHAEACLAALLARGRTGPPIVYCVHTLLGQELSTYLRKEKVDSWRALEIGHRGLRRSLDAAGRRVDSLLAARVDGWIALTHSSSRVMERYSRGVGCEIPAPMPDPRTDPDRLEAGPVARRHGLSPGRFFLYSGNLDGYQELGLISEAARRLQARAGDAAPGSAARLVVASHDPRVVERLGPLPGLSAVQVADAAEMRALIEAARACLLTRRTAGGFPIKLLNAHAAGTPTIAFLEREWGLRHEHDGLIARADRPAEGLVEAIERLEQDDLLVARLGQGARGLYERRHRPALVAERTRALIESIRDRRAAPPARSRAAAR